MDEPLNRPAAESQAVLEPSVTEQLESLRQLAISIMVLLLIVAGAFDLYLLRQVKYANQELTGIRPQAEQYIANWQKQGVPFMDNFLRDITQYGQTHPDFAPILSKYQLKPQVGPSPALPGTSLPAPASGSAPLPKKQP